MVLCYYELKICISHVFGTRKKRMRSISSLKNWFTAIWSTKKCIPDIWKLKNLDNSYFEPEKLFRRYLERKKWIPAIRTQKNLVHNSLEQVKRG